MACITVLYEDNHLLAVAKPAGVPTMGTPAEQVTLLRQAKEYIKQQYRKPGNVYLGVMSRLDAPVTGVVLFARTSKAAARLTEQFRAREVEKLYWAIVAGAPRPTEGILVDWVAEDERHRRMHVVTADTEGARDARLRFRTLRNLGNDSLLEIALETGRKHQIRLQWAKRGHPVIGDRKYGSGKRFPAGIALHARRLVVRHPVRDVAVELVAPLPEAWRRYGVTDSGL
ncbi:MAG: RluA family pseudouridine synthase [Planctomycetota bacterium]